MAATGRAPGQFARFGDPAVPDLGRQLGRQRVQVAGLVAGAMSMAAGEYVSVSSQSDTERADLDRERAELATDPVHEHKELASIYVGRGLSPDLAAEVSTQLMAHDALGAHARDELGIVDTQRARPVLAALTSAGTFAVGALVPLLVALVTPIRLAPVVVSAAALVLLAGLGGLAAGVGGASTVRGATRVALWGALAMGLTYAVGALFGTLV